MTLHKRVEKSSHFLCVFGPDCLLAGGDRHSGTLGITLVTGKGSVGWKTHLYWLK